MPVHLINSEQIGISEQLCDGRKAPYYQIRLYIDLFVIIRKHFLKGDNE